MRHLRIVVLLCCTLLFPSTAKSGQFEDGLLTLWESLWNQSGNPTLLNRWESNTVSYRFFGENLDVHRKHFEKILSQTSALTGITFEDISNQVDAKEKAQFHVEVVSNNGDIPERLACYVRPLKTTNFQLVQVELRMRDRHAYGCNLHEMMHAMGVHGHPSGDTVLTYFNTRADKFLPFDEFLLKAWYSPKIKSGMTPFQTMEVLSRAWAEEFKSSRPDANEVRREFLLKTFADMEKFASEKGEVPRILIRSGMLVAATVAQARLDMNWLLGFSYQHGHIVNTNLAQAERWYKSGAVQGNSPSMFLLGMLNERKGRIESEYLEKAYYWHTVATAYKHPSATVARNRLASRLSPEITAKLDAEAATFKPID
jgi:Protein of unknown function (DUF2927)